ncbi:MAG: metallophosphoesterase [Empedobacter falsenii]
MKIQYISDLHLDRQQNRIFFEKNPILPHAEYLILAGDIIPINQIDLIDSFLDHISQVFTKVFWLPGNHEFYGLDYNEYQSCTIPIRENIFLVNNQSIIIDDYELLFSTLWSNLDLDKRWFLQYHINDFKYIKYKKDHIDALDYNEFHTDSLAFLTNALNQIDSRKVIVITHHCPILLSLKDQESFQSVYCSQLDDMILKYQPLYWLYGHTHTSNNLIQVSVTKLLTNQFDSTENTNELVKTIDF